MRDQAAILQNHLDEGRITEALHQSHKVAHLIDYITYEISTETLALDEVRSQIELCKEPI